MGTVSAITIPLKTEKWQEDILYKRMESCRSMYNAMLNERMKAYRKMISSEEYKNCIDVIHSAYKADNEKEKKKIKRSPEYKSAIEKQKAILLENGFSAYSFQSISYVHAQHYKDVIPSNVTCHTVGIPMWRAFERMIFGNGKTVHYKKAGDIRVLETNGISGMRVVDDSNTRVISLEYGVQYYCYYKSKVGKKLKLPILTDKKDAYLNEMVSNEIRGVRIIRKRVGNRDRYLLQLDVLGEPAIKYDAYGNELHPVGDKKLGIYIDTVSITIYDGEEITVLDLGMGTDKGEEERSLSRYMDASRRISNPDNFNEDGTVRKGVVRDGRKVPLTWHYSKGYYRAKDRLADIRRVHAEQRKIRANIIANHILEMGHEIHINDYPFQVAMQRIKFPEGEELTKEGTRKSTRKAGRAIRENAPSMIVSILDNKLKARGYDGVAKHKIKNVDTHIKDYRSVYAVEMFKK